MKRIVYFAIRNDTVYDNSLISMVRYWREMFSNANDLITLVIIESFDSEKLTYRLDDDSAPLNTVDTMEDLAQAMFDKGLRFFATPTSKILVPMLPWVNRKYKETEGESARLNVVNLTAVAPEVLQEDGVSSLAQNAVSLLRIRPLFRELACSGDSYAVVDDAVLNSAIFERLEDIVKIKGTYTNDTVHQVKAKLRPNDNLWILTFDGSFLDETYPKANYISFDTLMDSEINPKFKHKLTTVDFFPFTTDINAKYSVIGNSYINTAFYFSIQIANIPNPNTTQEEIDIQLNRLFASISSFDTNLNVPLYTFYLFKQGIWHRPGEEELFENLWSEIRHYSKLRNIHPMYVWFLYTRYFIATFTIETASTIPNLCHQHTYSEQDIMNFIDNLYALKDFSDKDKLKKVIKDIGDFTDYIRQDSYLNDDAKYSTALY